MWDQFLYMSEINPGEGPIYTYIMRTENLEEDLRFVLKELVLELFDEACFKKDWPWCVSLNARRPWMEGIEQWMREELYTPEMVSQVYEQDAPIFERFGYTFEQHYYYLGGCGTSCHGTRLGDFEDEKRLSGCWAEWGSGRPGPFVRP